MRPPEMTMHPKTVAEWHGWLSTNYARPEGVLRITYKRSSGKQEFTIEAAIEDALYFGWIDSKPGKLDGARTKLWFAPRKAKSGWSRLKERVESLIASGRMTAAGVGQD